MPFSLVPPESIGGRADDPPAPAFGCWWSWSNDSSDDVEIGAVAKTIPIEHPTSKRVVPVSVDRR